MSPATADAIACSTRWLRGMRRGLARTITVVSGNVPLEMGVQTALYTAELCGADVPVHAG